MCLCNFRPTRAEAVKGRALWDIPLMCFRAFCRALLDLVRAYRQTVWKWAACWAQRWCRLPQQAWHPPHSISILPQQSAPYCTWHFLSDVYFVGCCYLSGFLFFYCFEQLAEKERIYSVTETEMKGTIPLLLLVTAWAESLWADWGCWLMGSQIFRSSEVEIHVHRQWTQKDLFTLHA